MHLNKVTNCIVYLYRYHNNNQVYYRQLYSNIMSDSDSNKMASNTSQSEWGKNASMITDLDRRLSSNTNTSREERRQKKKEKKVLKKLLDTQKRPAVNQPSSGSSNIDLSQYLEDPIWTSHEITNYEYIGHRVPKDVVRVRILPCVVKIDNNAFCKCSDLREVVFSEGLKTIGDAAFARCETLERITLPSTVTDIEKDAFLGCTMLREVACSGALPSIEWNTFSGCPLLERITFPNLSTRLEDIIRAGQVGVQNKLQQCMIRGVIEWRRGGMIYIPVEVTTRRTGWALVQQRFHQIVNWIKYYEMKEATTIFELALWKAKMIDRGHLFGSRDECRVEMPGPVKDTILQYLYGVEIPVLPSMSS